MTEDLAMQQKRKGNYAIPGAIAGAAIGGVGGAAAAHYKNWGYTQKPSEEQIAKMFEQAPDTFNGKIENASGDVKTFYEKVKAEAENVNGIKDGFESYKKELEKNIEYDLEKDLPDGELKNKLNEACDSYKTARSTATLNIEGINELAKTNPKEAEQKINEYIKEHNLETFNKYENAITEAKNELLKLEKYKNQIDKGLTEKYGAATLDDSLKLAKEKGLENIKEYAEKVKIGNKTVTGLIAGAGVALAGALIGYAIKKDQA